MKPHPRSRTASRPAARLALLAAVAALLLAPAGAFAQDQADGDDQTKSEGLTLEQLFPEDGLFGPRAYGAAFSANDRYAAYLWRPYEERRHGSDLWLHDYETGETTRVTSAIAMARFQDSAREVVEDRTEKERARRKKEEGQNNENGDENGDGNGDGGDAPDAEGVLDGLDDEFGDVVQEGDADADDDPRYSGVATYTWAPEDNELIFTSQNDLYRFDVGDNTIERLTATRSRESDVQYLPDGSGYTFLDDGALIRIGFGSDEMVQLDPALPSGERMTGYRISPDGEKLVFLSTKGRSWAAQGRKVSIVRYRNRFAEVREVTRHMPDSPFEGVDYGVYHYTLGDPMSESGELVRIHTHKQSGPRDSVRVPEWSPDSSRVALSIFEQESGEVHILESVVEPEDSASEEDEENSEENGEGENNKNEEQADEDGVIDRPAEVVYRFMHAGGPNTPNMIDPDYLPDSRSMAFITEISGFRHMHVLDPVWGQLEQLTSGRYEVYPFDLSDDQRRMYVTATKGDPTQQHVFELDLVSGEMEQLTEVEGFYSGVAVSDGGDRVIASHADFGSLREMVAFDVRDADEPLRLTDSHPEKAHELTEPIPEYFTYTNRVGQDIYGHMFKPDDWSADGEYPLLIYVYGGPLGTRKSATRGSFSSASYFFAYYMAKEHGYVTATIDPRGQSGYGAKFENANFNRIGKPQVDDLADGVRHMIDNQGVDPERVGIHGWSFGGFQTQMALYTEPDVFKVGIAGAGPTEWYNYNTWYTTGTVAKKEDLDDIESDDPRYSLLSLAENLEGKLLLVHGMEDSNVLFQDTIAVYRKLLQAGKEAHVDLFLDPTGGHGLGGDVETVNRYRKYEEYLLRTLDRGPGANGDRE